MRMECAQLPAHRHECLCYLLDQWQPDLKAGVAGLRGELDGSAVFLYDSLDRVEAEAGAFAYSFGGEEGFKDVRLDVGGYSRPVVGDGDDNAAVVGISSDTKLAASVHGVNRVVDDVRPNLI